VKSSRALTEPARKEFISGKKIGCIRVDIFPYLPDKYSVHDEADVVDALADRTKRWERDVLGQYIVVTGLDYATHVSPAILSGSC
jgi:hypothetical protein